ncbi:MAG: hypothetical protein ACR2PL_06915 [Dehalococcoidia bacterium]
MAQIAKTAPTLNADPNWPLFVRAIDYGWLKAYNQYYPAWSDVLAPAQDVVAAGKQTPKQATDDAQKKVEAEIARNKK